MNVHALPNTNISINLDAIPKRPGIYIVGGAVRDRLLGRDSYDIDIAVRENPQKLAEQIADRTHSRVISLGRPTQPLFRVLTPNHMIDISAFQGDNLTADLLRRDFTINSIAYDTWSHKVIDVTGGIKDIHARLLRQVSSTSFQSDPLRTLRAYRLASQLGFQIESDTRRSLRQAAALIRTSAAERILTELSAILAGPRVHYWVECMADTTILFQIFPELSSLVGCRQGGVHAFDVFEHTMRTLRALEQLITGVANSAPEIAALFDSMSTQRRVRLYFAALLHDIGKPVTRQESELGRIRFYGHDKTGAQMIAPIGLRLRLSRKDIDSIVQLVHNHLRPLHLYKACKHNQLHDKGLTRFFIKTTGFAGDLLLLSLADMRAKTADHGKSLQDFEDFLAKVANYYITNFKSRSKTAPLINGFDLMEKLHLRPSPLFSRILQHVREAQLSGHITNPKEALALAAEITSQMQRSPTSGNS